MPAKKIVLHSLRVDDDDTLLDFRVHVMCLRMSMSGAGAQFMQYGGRDIPIWFCNSFANTFDNLYIFQFGAHVRKFEQQANP